jgi:hypothetical protein
MLTLKTEQMLEINVEKTKNSGIYCLFIRKENC